MGGSVEKKGGGERGRHVAFSNSCCAAITYHFVFLLKAECFQTLQHVIGRGYVVIGFGTGENPSEECVREARMRGREREKRR